jgi:hypothetical protein
MAVRLQVRSRTPSAPPSAATQMERARIFCRPNPFCGMRPYAAKEAEGGGPKHFAAVIVLGHGNGIPLGRGRPYFVRRTSSRTIWDVYPHSLSYQANTFTRSPSTTVVMLKSTIVARGSWMTSAETSWSSVAPRMPR